MFDADEIKKMIQEDRLDKFYTSRQWRRVARQVRELQHNECQRCKAQGFYEPCEVVHHKKYIKYFPELALKIDNLECLCFECHEEEHGRGRYNRAKNTDKEPLTPERW